MNQPGLPEAFLSRRGNASRWTRSALLGVLLAPIVGHLAIAVVPFGSLFKDQTFVAALVVWLGGGLLAGFVFGLSYPRWCFAWGALLGVADLIATHIEVERWNDNLGPPNMLFLWLWIGVATAGSLLGGGLRGGWWLVQRIAGPTQRV